MGRHLTPIQTVHNRPIPVIPPPPPPKKYQDAVDREVERREAEKSDTSWFGVGVLLAVLFGGDE